MIRKGILEAFFSNSFTSNMTTEKGSFYFRGLIDDIRVAFINAQPIFTTRSARVGCQAFKRLCGGEDFSGITAASSLVFDNILQVSCLICSVW